MPINTINLVYCMKDYARFRCKTGSGMAALRRRGLSCVGLWDSINNHTIDAVQCYMTLKYCYSRCCSQ